MMSVIRSLWKDEQAQGMVEYGLIIALVAIAVIAAIMAMSGQLQTTFNNIASRLTAANQ